MKYLLFFLSIFCGISCASETIKETPANEVNTANGAITSGVVDVSTFVKLMEGDHILLDVRTPEEFSEGYIANAKNINFYDDDFSERVITLNKNEPVLVYCKKGSRSAKACKVLKDAGFKTIYDLEGGFTAWQSAKQPIAK
jgi:rhodanese-related sulfurtransferase